MNKVTKYINERIDGNVFDKPSILDAYSRDRSILKITPRFVIVPSSSEDIQAVVKLANDLAARDVHLPLSVRGSGLDKTGADLSEGAVISLENLDQVLEVDEDARLVRAQTGVTLGKLSAVLSAYGLALPVDADPRETLADLIAGYRLDDISGKYGSTLYYTERLEVVTSTGELLQTSPLSPRALRRLSEHTSFADHLYLATNTLTEKHFDLLDDIKAAPRDFGGYRMLANCASRRGFDLMPLFFGANHTLGIVTEVILRVEPIRRPSHRLLAAFKDADSAMPFITALQAERPAAANLFDSNVVRIAALHGKKLDILPLENKGLYITAQFDDNKFKALKKLRRLADISTSAAKIVLEDAKNSEEFDNLGQLLAQFLNDEEVVDRPAILDDISIPEAELPGFLSDLNLLERTYDREMPVIGSVSTGLYTLRPEFNLSDVTERRHLIEFLRSLTNLVRDHHGSLTGGTAEGRVKGALLQFDPREKALFAEIKQLFDPNNILNPNAKLGATLPDLARHLRTDANSGIAKK